MVITVLVETYLLQLITPGPLVALHNYVIYAMTTPL